MTATVQPARPGGLAAGKVRPELLEQLLQSLPPGPPELLLGPGLGEDACAISLPRGILVAATDPVTLTSERIGPWSVVVNANDVAVSGARPRWFLAVILVPPGSSDAAILDLQRGIRDELGALGAHLVGGHTEVTSAVTRPVVVGQMLGLAEDGVIVTSGGSAAGDVLVQIGPVPVEGAAVLALGAADRLDELDEAAVDAARNAIVDPGISVVEQALLAKQLGATALHDPTEGGLAAGLHEVASASHICLRVDEDAILWFEPGLAVCHALGADPWSTLASGSLLATFPPQAAALALATFAGKGYQAAAIGSVCGGSGVEGRSSRPIPWPVRDAVDAVFSTV